MDLPALVIRMVVHIRRLLVDALKPRETSLVELSKAICSVDGVEECDLSVTDVDANTETVKLTVRGPDIRYEDVVKILDEYSISIKGVDEVSVLKSKQVH